MSPEPWLYALYILIGGVHAVTVLYAYWAKLGSVDGVEPVDSTERAVQSTELNCPECGATNEHRYKYCASCVSELPDRENVGETPTKPVGRQIL